jgi:hypothetical protein
MDAKNAPSRDPTPANAAALNQDATQAPVRGGTVEPANRATVAKEQFQTPIEPTSPRYELHDPFAEVTYRSKSFPEIVAKANQLGSSRFVEVDEQGQRTVVQRANGRWEKAATPNQHTPNQHTKTTPEPPPRSTPERDGSGVEPSAATPGNSTGLARATPEPALSPAHAPLSALDAKAEREALVSRLEAALAERYVIKRAPITVGEVKIGRTEYRYRGDTMRVAFTESTFRLATDTNNPSVARSMVDVAQARNWKALRVAGNEEFKRLVWLEANTRGVKTLGYEPSQTDLELLKHDREARLVNRIEPERTIASDGAATTTTTKAKASERGAGGRKTVLAAIEAVLVSKGVPERQREAVMVAAAEKLEQRIRAGQTPKVKIYDPAVPSQRPVVIPTPEKQRTRDRAAPTR